MSQAAKPIKTAPKAPKPAAKKQPAAAMPETKRAAAKKAVAKKAAAKKAAVKKGPLQRELGAPALVKSVKSKKAPLNIQVIHATPRGQKVTYTSDTPLSEPTQRRVIIFEGREIDIDAVKARLTRRIATSAARANEKTMGVMLNTTPTPKKLNAETIQNLVKNAASGQSRPSTKPTR